MDDGLYFAIKLLYVLPFSKYSTPKVLSTEQFLRSDIKNHVICAHLCRFYIAK